MCKKRVSLLLVILLMFLSTGGGYAQSIYSLGVNNMGYLDVGSANYGDNMRILVEKDQDRYYYSLDKDKEYIPLQLGNGNYTVKILENIKDKRYRVVSSENVFLKEHCNKIYLNSTQPVYWHKSTEISKLAKDITKNSQTDLEKVEKVYNYIITNIDYDDYKINYLKDNYVPNIMEIINAKKGICYDYSAVFAGMLRSLDIPTKLVKGYKDDLESYHAWNEVLIDDNWYIIDTTYDAALQKGKENVIIFKEAKEYTKIREY